MQYLPQLFYDTLEKQDGKEQLQKKSIFLVRFCTTCIWCGLCCPCTK